MDDLLICFPLFFLPCSLCPDSGGRGDLDGWRGREEIRRGEDCFVMEEGIVEFVWT